MRVDVQCLDAQSRSYVWHARFDQAKETAFRLQDEITLRILKELDIQLSTAERSRIQYLDDTQNLDAWLAAANGLRHLIRVTESDVELARASYARALQLDPGYVSARRGLAWCAFLSVRLGWTTDPAAAIAEAKNQLGIVLRDQPDDGMTRSLEGAILLLEESYGEAIAAGERATELLAGSADAWAVLAHTQTYVGAQEQALANIARAMELSEIDPAWYRWTLGRALRMAGQFDQSISILEPQEGGQPRSIVQLAELTASYAAAGRLGEARETAAQIRRMAPDFTATAWLQHPHIEVPEIQSKEFEYLSAAGL